ncbi:MAG: hypothetical protein NC117_08340 [Pseudoflavonifractor sp.]|nr:hypothetical protein [Pseudoflavonifractor sp.]
MKKFLLSVAALAAFTAANAQTTFNFFDPADCDANGWLWFDTQEKIDKYCGFGSNYKIQLQSVTFEDADGQFAEPECYPDEEGYNAAGELGGEGSKTGAIILPGGTSSYGTETGDGGGFMLWLPDCAEFDLFLSTEDEKILVALRGAADSWVEAIDCATVRAYMKMGFFIDMPLAKTSQFQWNNIQDVKNEVTGLQLASPKGQKVTALLRNNMKAALLVQGMKVLTYTNTQAGVDGIESDATALTLALDGKTLSANADAAISVYTADGALVATANGSALSLDNLAEGVYVAKAVNAKGSATLKLAL